MAVNYNYVRNSQHQVNVNANNVETKMLVIHPVMLGLK
uniref:Uncharacterized protein n=1 Tax=Glossina morsitans morsitans TaxID=37546 RepID=A0A1B0G8X5_GLOMM